MSSVASVIKKGKLREVKLINLISPCVIVECPCCQLRQLTEDNLTLKNMETMNPKVKAGEYITAGGIYVKNGKAYQCKHLKRKLL